MPSLFRTSVALTALCALTAGPAPARAAAPRVAHRTGREAAERGVGFLLADAAKWRQERKCSTCHHGTMTVWALSEARAQGFPVTAESVADMARWTKERLKDVDKPRDPRPGWKMVNTPALYLSLMAQAVPGQQALSADEVRRIAGHLLRHQEADGAWAWSSAPAQNRPPPVFESDEVATRLAYLALGPHAPARGARAKAAAWLGKTGPGDTTQAAALRLLVKAQAGEARPADVDRFLARQNRDGGWGQLPGLPSDAYATGQALYTLSLVGLKNDRAEVRRAVAFLVATQKEDGSWPMIARAHPGARPARNTAPITHLGSAWATLGLLRWVPKGARPAPRR
jgi:squalene-hopene/tetraprenyl-beta-curcumene cyclase